MQTRITQGPVIDVLGDVVYGAAVLSLILRYVRGNDRIRRQMLWLLLAVGIVLVVWTIPDLRGVETPLSLTSDDSDPVGSSPATWD